MSYPTRFYRVARTLLIAVMLQGMAAACDVTGPVDSDGMRIRIPRLRLCLRVLQRLHPPGTRSTFPGREPGARIRTRCSDPAPGRRQLRLDRWHCRSELLRRGLSGATTYCYRIRSLKSAGRKVMYSAYSDPVCATTPAPPPINAPSATEALPQGSSGSSGEVDRQFSGRRGLLHRTCAGPGRSVDLSQYSARERDFTEPVCQSGRVYLLPCDCLHRRPAFAPLSTGLHGRARSPNGLLSGKPTVNQSINLQWTDNSSVEDGYEVRRYYYGGGWTVIATLPANASSYLDDNLTVNVRYTYEVRKLWRDGGYGNTSAPISALAPTELPGAPSAAQAFFDYDYWYSDYYFFITWQVGSANEEGYRIEIADRSGGGPPTSRSHSAGAWGY